MTPRLAVAALATVILAASAGSCEELPEGVPTNLPTIPTDLPELPDVPTNLPDIPTDLPDLPTSIPDLPTVLPDLGGDEVEPEETAVAPAPETVEPSVPVGEELVAEEDPVPWWVWGLLALALLGLLLGLVLLGRSRQRQGAWRVLWGELTTEARWIDERVVPSVQDRGVSPATAAMRWTEGRRRLEALDRRVYDEAFRAQTAEQGVRLDELSGALVGLRDAVDAEVEVRQNGATDDDPRLAAAAEDVAAARDELRRVLAGQRR